MSINRIRYKIFTSFALSALCVLMVVRLWSVAPPSPTTAAAYAIAFVLFAAALWRGIIFARAAGHQAR